MDMKRTELERQLRALGWTKVREIPALATAIWTRGGVELPVPTDDIVLPSVAADILDMARR